MVEDKREIKNKDKDAQSRNSLQMIDPSIIGTPLGPVSVVPIPVRNIGDKEKLEGENDTDT